MLKSPLFCRLFVVAGFLVSSGAVHAQDCPKDDLSPMCEDRRAQAVYERADSELNIVYQQLVKKMSQPPSEYLDYPTLKTKFIEAQRQWVRFRNNECDAWYVINQAGTGRNADQMTCLVARTKDRTKQLKEWAAYLP